MANTPDLEALFEQLHDKLAAEGKRSSERADQISRFVLCAKRELHSRIGSVEDKQASLETHQMALAVAVDRLVQQTAGYQDVHPKAIRDDNITHDRISGIDVEESTIESQESGISGWCDGELNLTSSTNTASSNYEDALKVPSPPLGGKPPSFPRRHVTLSQSSLIDRKSPIDQHRLCGPSVLSSGYI